MSESMKAKFNEADWIKHLAKHDEYKETISEAIGNKSWNLPKPRVGFVLESAKQMEKRGKALDVGCGTQLFTANGLRELGFDVYCLDIFPRPFNKFIRADAHHLPLKDNDFQVVHAGAILQLLFFPEKFIEEVYRVLEEDGLFFLHSVEKESWEGADIEYKGYYRNEVRALMEKVGFEVLRQKVTLDFNLVTVAKK